MLFSLRGMVYRCGLLATHFKALLEEAEEGVGRPESEVKVCCRVSTSFVGFFDLAALCSVWLVEWQGLRGPFPQVNKVGRACKHYK